jgi:TonB family protein
MFNNLIESDSHREELARKSRFFLGTLAFYALLFAVGGVASIYAYDAHLENQNLELVTLLPPVEPTAPAETPHNERPRQTERASNDNREDVRRVLIVPIETSTLRPNEVSSRPLDTPAVRAGIPTVLGDVNSNANIGRPVGPTGTGTGDGVRLETAPTRVEIAETTPPPPMPSPSPVQKNVIVSLGVITAQMLNRPVPPYPPMGKAVGAQGPVTIQVVIDETGKVISARAVSGHPLLRAAAVQAAYQARFSPTLLSKQPVKASGTITFNFQLQK